jgi:antitoxin PrlF
MRITSKGQVTIPKPIRDEAGLLPGSEVEFTMDDGVVTVRRSHAAPSRGEELVQRLRGGRQEFSMTTEQIMALTRGEE